MNRRLSQALLGLGALVACGSAFAWPKCPDGSTSTKNEQGQYVCPPQNSGGTPIVINEDNTINVDATNRLAASSRSNSDSRSASDALSQALAQGGNADANAIGQNWNMLTPTQQSSFMASLNPSQRAALTAALSSYNPSNANVDLNHVGSNNGARLNGTGNGGGANVTTNNSSVSKVLQVNLPATPAVAPAVTAAQGITITGTCGPLREVESIPVEYLLVGHIGMDKVQLSGQMTDRLVPVKGEDGKVKNFNVVDNGDGTKSEMGTIASEAIVMVSGSTSKQFGFGVIGSNGGGNASNGSSGAVVITQRIIVTGSCELRRYKEVPLVTTTQSGTTAIAGLTKDDLLAAEARIAEALQRATLSARAEVEIPEREWVPCPKEGCKAPEGGYYRYKPRKAIAESASTLKQSTK